MIFKLRPPNRRPLGLFSGRAPSRWGMLSFSLAASKAQGTGKQSISRILHRDRGASKWQPSSFFCFLFRFGLALESRTDGVALNGAQRHLFGVSFSFWSELSRFDWIIIIGKHKNLVQNVPTKQNYFFQNLHETSKSKQRKEK